jgi:uncharacterized protein (DUF1015 family)
MALIRPLHAVHYDLSVAGALQDLVAPPYDVIDAEQRSQLAARSPYNVVGLDLPQAADGADPYQTAGALMARWRQEGVLTADDQGAIWAHTQDYTGPDGVKRTRRGFFCAVHIEEYGPGRVRPHERTHPGPKEDRLRLTRATRCNMSPIFSLYSDPAQDAWAALQPFVGDSPWGQATDDEGTVHRIWRVADPAAIAAVAEVAGRSELLIADGHHRYETAQTYAAEVDAESGAPADDSAAHHYVLMCLVALEDPGLTVFPTHRLVAGVDEARRAALWEVLQRDFDIREVALEQLAPDPASSTSGEDGKLQLGFIDARDRRPLRLTLKDQAIADAALPDYSDAYRHLDTGVLEAILLKGPLGLTDDDISHLHGFGYARQPADAMAGLDAGTYDLAFIMRPTPVEQVKEVAAAGENMPPKSTYFFPKLLTGLLFNPLA